MRVRAKNGRVGQEVKGGKMSLRTRRLMARYLKIGRSADSVVMVKDQSKVRSGGSEDGGVDDTLRLGVTIRDEYGEGEIMGVEGSARLREMGTKKYGRVTCGAGACMST